MADEKPITIKREENFSDWFVQVITKSEFVDYSSVSGGTIFREDSYYAWEVIQRAVDDRFKADGVSNVYFPMFIPEKLLNKEKEHIEGFRAEVAWVTHGGNTKLEERLAIRPTSEAIMYESYAKWIRSWRDLPFRHNQWNSVVRWEFKHPTPLLRSREFLWNEGHSVFATEDEASQEGPRILAIYTDVLKEYLALPGILGKKTDSEKFAGGLASYSIEHLMPDGKAIQGPDHHQDGQNFAKAFEIQFLDKDNNYSYPYQNTYAISTRELGVMVSIHGDNKGLVIPPKLARIQIVIVPIFDKKNKDAVIDFSKSIAGKLEGKFRVLIDDSDAYSPGWKFNNWELKGVPVRLEIGMKEVEKKTVTAARRDLLKKSVHSEENILKDVTELMENINSTLYERALKYLNDHIFPADTFSEMKDIVEARKGFAQSPWCGSDLCEAKIKEETGGKITNMPLDVQDHAKGKKCVICGEDAKHIANIARSY